MTNELNLSVASMTKCERLHLLGNGCSRDNYDSKCKDCPYQRANDTLNIDAAIAKSQGRK